MKELVKFIAQSLVDNPEQVQVNEIEGEQTSVIELKVAKEDLGKVIGKQGRTARAMRTILSAASTKVRKRAVLEILRSEPPDAGALIGLGQVSGAQGLKGAVKVRANAEAATSDPEVFAALGQVWIGGQGYRVLRSLAPQKPGASPARRRPQPHPGGRAGGAGGPGGPPAVPAAAARGILLVPGAGSAGGQRRRWGPAGVSGPHHLHPGS